MIDNHKSIEKLLKEIVAAYKATQNQPIDAPDQIKHLRYQVARLARVCIEMEKRISELAHKVGDTSEPKKASGVRLEEDEETMESQITAVGDII